MNNYLSEYLYYIAGELNLSTDTKRAYERDLRQYLEYLSKTFADNTQLRYTREHDTYPTIRQEILPKLSISWSFNMFRTSGSSGFRGH